MFGCSYSVAGGSIDHHYALPGSSVNIDIIQANTGSGNNLKFLASLDDFSSSLSLAAYYQRLVVADYTLELLGLELQLNVDFGLSLPSLIGNGPKSRDDLPD